MRAMERSRCWRALGAMVVGVLLVLSAAAAFAAVANINPSMDTTVSEDFPDNSSGACDSIFAGNSDGGFARRAFMQFDIAAAIPLGATINSVTLSMNVTRGSNHVDSTFTLHPVNAAWVEGPEGCGVRGGGQGDPSAGGVTWNTQPGFGAASGSTLINDTSPVWASTAAMVSDVQGWLDNPGSNDGWVLIGDENNSTTTRRFDSREGGTPPSLVVDFTCVGNCEACCADDGTCTTTVFGSGNCEAGGGIPQGDGTTCEPNMCPQPIGACCNADRSCTDEDRLVCIGNGGTFVGGNCNQADCGLAPFVEPLPIPPILASTGTNAEGYPTYTVSVEEATQSVHPDLPDTTVWTYNGAWPGATIVATKGQPIEVTYQNNLPAGGGGRGSNLLEVDTCAHGPNYWGDAKRIVTHLHGGHVPSRVDGQPELTLLPGEIDTYVYPNNQDAATLWYHDHALGITRLNVYGGLAGFYLIADDEDTLGPGNAFGLPSGPQYEIGLAIQDRSFNADGSLFYNAQLEDAFKGDYAVVNGKVAPYLNVNQGKYRFRLLNGSQSREYILELKNLSGTTSTTTGLVDPHFTLVGTDVGLVSAPIDLTNKFGRFVPAERMDVVIDFQGYPAGTEIVLGNAETTPPLLPSIMKFIVTNNPGYTGTISSTLRPVTPMVEGSQDVTRYFRLVKNQAVACKDGSGRLANEWLVQSLDGPGGNVTGEQWDDVSDLPILGNREIWEFENPTNVMHPMHVHLVRFQILSKTDLTTGQPIQLKPWEVNTWKDIVRVPANSKARIIMDFADYLGRFPTHCHILDHEDHEMMRQFQTTYDPAYCDNDGTCDPGEDCQSCPADCAQVSGALCGNGLCEGGDGENCLTCPADCAGKQKGSASKQFCCGDADAGNPNGPIGCGVDANDNRCIDASNSLACRVEPRNLACCGDKLCEGAETIASCANDCDPNVCTPTEFGTEVTCNDGQDNDCDGLTDAADPDCQTCVPSETPEQSCFDGNDNDCDTLTDCADNDCNGATDGSCNTGQPGICAAGTRNCSGGGEVCQQDTPAQEESAAAGTCNDGLDNDCDGLTDASDPDCQTCVPDEPEGEVSCFDGNDNDCDLDIDCADNDCNGAVGAPTTCGVGECAASGNVECQGGNQVDSCSPGSPPEDPEVTCNDGLDNDCDGLTDANDPDCQVAADCSQYGNRTSCNNDPNCRWKKNACVPR